MTADDIPTFDVEEIFPDGPDPVDHALTQLREPHRLLAEALVITRAAQVVGQDIDTHDGLGLEALEQEQSRHRRLLDEAFQLSQLAKIASELAVAERQMPPVPVVDDLDEKAMQPSPTDRGPEAVQMRFTADLIGMPVGRVAQRAWVWLAGHGFIDVSDAREFDADGQPGYTLSGRVVSLTDEHMLGVMLSGAPVCLPLDLVTTLEPDE